MPPRYCPSSTIAIIKRRRERGRREKEEAKEKERREGEKERVYLKGSISPSVATSPSKDNKLLSQHVQRRMLLTITSFTPLLSPPPSPPPSPHPHMRTPRSWSPVQPHRILIGSLILFHLININTLLLFCLFVCLFVHTKFVYCEPKPIMRGRRERKEKRLGEGRRGEEEVVFSPTRVLMSIKPVLSAPSADSCAHR